MVILYKTLLNYIRSESELNDITHSFIWLKLPPTTSFHWLLYLVQDSSVGNIKINDQT